RRRRQQATARPRQADDRYARGALGAGVHRAAPLPRRLTQAPLASRRSRAAWSVVLGAEHDLVPRGDAGAPPAPGLAPGLLLFPARFGLLTAGIARGLGLGENFGGLGHVLRMGGRRMRRWGVLPQHRLMDVLFGVDRIRTHPPMGVELVQQSRRGLLGVV